MTNILFTTKGMSISGIFEIITNEMVDFYSCNYMTLFFFSANETCMFENLKATVPFSA